MENWSGKDEDKKLETLFQWQKESQAVPDELKEKIIRHMVAATEGKQSRQLPRPLYYLAAAALLLLIPLGIFIFLQSGDLKLQIITLTGQIKLNRNARVLALVQGAVLQRQDVLRGEQLSGYSLVYPQEIRLSVAETSHLELLELKRKEIEVNFFAGRLAAEVQSPGGITLFVLNNTSFKATTREAIFTLQTGTNGSLVSVSSGSIHLYIPANSQQAIQLQAGQSMHIQAEGPAAPVLPEDRTTLTSPQVQTTGPPRLTSLLTPVWKWEHVFTAESRLLGFCATDALIIGVTNSCIRGFTPSGRLLWQQQFSKDEVYFESLPVIFKDTAYISLKDNIMLIDTSNGAVRKIAAPGMLSRNIQISRVQDTLLMPYPDGIYLFLPQKEAFDFGAIIPHQSPTSLLVHAGRLITGSLLEPLLAAYSLQGKPLFQLALKAPSLCPPVALGPWLVIGDQSGTLYRINSEPAIRDTLELGAAILSITTLTERSLAVYTAAGRVMFIDAEKWQILQELDMQTSGQAADLIYNTPALLNGVLLAGSGAGVIKMIAGDTLVVENEFAISAQPLSCLAITGEDSFAAGTTGGEIIFFHLTREQADE